VSRLSRQCRIFNIWQPYRPPRPVTGIALLLQRYLALIIQCLSRNNIFFSLLHFTPKTSPRTPGGTRAPGWRPLNYMMEEHTIPVFRYLQMIHFLPLTPYPKCKICILRVSWGRGSFPPWLCCDWLLHNNQASQTINSMRLSHYWEADSCAATQEISNILWKPKVHCRVHKSPPLARILSQVNPVHTSPSCLRSILILSTDLCLRFPSGLFPSGFPTNNLY
jgi:hypothetical protein